MTQAGHARAARGRPADARIAARALPTSSGLLQNEDAFATQYPQHVDDHAGGSVAAARTDSGALRDRRRRRVRVGPLDAGGRGRFHRALAAVRAVRAVRHPARHRGPSGEEPGGRFAVVACRSQGRAVGGAGHARRRLALRQHPASSGYPCRRGRRRRSRHLRQRREPRCPPGPGGAARRHGGVRNRARRDRRRGRGRADRPGRVLAQAHRPARACLHRPTFGTVDRVDHDGTRRPLAS
jgi:hypothetical protein